MVMLTTLIKIKQEKLDHFLNSKLDSKHLVVILTRILKIAINLKMLNCMLTNTYLKLNIIQWWIHKVH